MTIVTKTGDKGETGLFGGQRVPKDDLRIETIGTVDELNAILGIVLADGSAGENLSAWLTKTQNMLFRAGADLATPHENNKAVVPRIEQAQIDELEQWIARLEQTPLPPYFVLPGGSKAAAHLHLARAVCRRAERCAVSLSHRTDLGPFILKYLNRLSDFLFLAALEANRKANRENIRVSYS
jgi:cob(I)alamin adenosyltransferase